MASITEKNKKEQDKSATEETIPQDTYNKATHHTTASRQNKKQEEKNT